MITATTIIELFNLLSPSEKRICSEAIAAITPQHEKKKRKKSVQLKPQHATDDLVYALVIKEKGIRTTKNTNSQAEKFACLKS